jgi:DeoR/GlpR family transcriptional regulator of sugar metabolism
LINNELLDEIELAVSNKAHLHVEDKRRIACIFFKLFKDGKFNLCEVERTVEALPEYSKSSKDIINEIANTIDSLAYC